MNAATGGDGDTRTARPALAMADPLIRRQGLDG